jgi:hypothetical protein
LVRYVVRAGLRMLRQTSTSIFQAAFQAMPVM